MQQNVENHMGEIEIEVENVKSDLFELKKGIDESKVTICHVLERLNNFELPYKKPSLSRLSLNKSREDILIGGDIFRVKVQNFFHGKMMFGLNYCQ